MIQKEIDEAFTGSGYRFCRGNLPEIGIYYKYYKEGFHVVISVDLACGYRMTPEQHHTMVEHVMGSFYHPKGVLEDFPEGFAVYHVEVLTLLVGGDAQLQREMCAHSANVWAYLTDEHRLLIYENQPGDFFGLRKTLEDMHTVTRGGLGAERIKMTLLERIKGISRNRKLPCVTVLLIAMNVIVYLIMELIGDSTNGAFVAACGGMYPTLLTDDHQWWRLLTAGFIHFGAAHLINNMLIFYCMGSRFEREAGHLRLLVIYILSLLGGSLLSYGMMLHTANYAVSAGASGAIFGVIGGFLWIVILHKGHLRGVTAKGIFLMLGLTIYYGFTSSGIDNWGHIGGVVTGFVSTIILYHRKCQKR